jgi:hypothetical protein
MNECVIETTVAMSAEDLEERRNKYRKDDRVRQQKKISPGAPMQD